MNYETHPKMKYLYIGIDTHKLTHTATIINCFNEKLETITFNNDTKGYNFLISTVDKHKENLIAIYGLEDTKHLGYGLATFLISKDLLVKNVNSNLTYVERKKNPIIFKNDNYDSECIAKVLLDYLDTLPNAKSDEIYWTLKQVVKMRKAIINNNIEYKCKLHAQLLHHYPNYNKMFTNIDGSTSLAIWERYPSPDLLLKEDIDVLTEYITKVSNGKLGIKKSLHIIEIVKEYSNINTNYQEERNVIIKMLVKQIKDNKVRLEEIEKEIISIYDKIDTKLHTYPCLDKVTSAYILAEIGNINRFSNSGKLARYSGIAPIDKSSGTVDKSLKNSFGNRELNCYIYQLACRSLLTGKNRDKPYNAIFYEYYHKKMNSGKTKHQAIICVMRRIINILYNILKNDIEYKIPNELIDISMNYFREQKQLEEERLKKKEKYSKKELIAS